MQKKGFTLIELLVVIAIIGLLATLSVISFSSSTVKARDTKRKNDLKTIQKALDLYYADYGAYPITGGWRGAGSTCAYGPYAVTGGAGAYIPGLAPTYINTIPIDPKPMGKPGTCASIGQSCYLYNSDGTDYKIISHCGIEGSFPAVNDPFYDPVRPNWGIMLCSGGATACGSW